MTTPLGWLGLLVIVGAALSLTFSALAHEHGAGNWINAQGMRDPLSGEQCCNRDDCQPAKDVREVVGGYVVETGEFIPARRVLWRSVDGQWWRCRVMHGPNVNKTRCLIGVPPGS